MQSIITTVASAQQRTLSDFARENRGMHCMLVEIVQEDATSITVDEIGGGGGRHWSPKSGTVIERLPGGRAHIAYSDKRLPGETFPPPPKGWVPYVPEAAQDDDDEEGPAF